MATSYRLPNTCTSSLMPVEYELNSSQGIIGPATSYQKQKQPNKRKQSTSRIYTSTHTPRLLSNHAGFSPMY
jgi:hypothetical protein